MPAFRRLARWLGGGAALALTAVTTLMGVRALDARGMPDLEPWHRLVPRAEMR